MKTIRKILIVMGLVAFAGEQSQAADCSHLGGRCERQADCCRNEGLACLQQPNLPGRCVRAGVDEKASSLKSL